MKEKITTIVTLSCVFSLFFYYKIYSSDNLNTVQNESVYDESVVNDLIEKIENETVENNISESSDLQNDSDIKESCSLSQDEVDLMTFSDSFKYHRDCNGKGAIFTWKSNEYSTFLASEKVQNIKNQVNIVDENSDTNDDIDKYSQHLQKSILETTVGNNN